MISRWFGIISVPFCISIISSQVRYPSMFPLFADLKGMGENSAAINRKLHLHRLVHPKSSPQKDTNQFNLLLRETLLAANAIYEELYGEAGQEGQGQAAVVLPATFQVCIGFCRTLWVPTLLLLFLFPSFSFPSFPFTDSKPSQPCRLLGAGGEGGA